MKKPRSYKCAAELSFLNDVFDFEDTVDSMLHPLQLERNDVDKSDDKEQKNIESTEVSIWANGVH